MAFLVVAYGEASEIEDLNQYAGALNGTALLGQPIVLTQLNSAALYALTVRNLDTGNCKVLQLKDHADARIMDVDGDQIKVGWPIVMDAGVFIQKHAKNQARQGGSATIWSTGGTTEYNPTNIVEEFGVEAWAGTAAISGTGTVTFKHAFAYAPHLRATPLAAGATTIVLTPQTVLATGFTYKWESRDGVTTFAAVSIHWVAVGPPA